jgi:hypothetical protein
VINVTVNQGTHPLSSADFPGTLDLSINGAKVQSQAVSAAGNYTFSYVPTADGAVTVQATITDSVLYSGSESATMVASTATTTGTGGNGNGNGNGNH